MANELIGLILLITMVQGRRIERYKTGPDLTGGRPGAQFT